MESLKSLRRRIRAVRSTGKITRAMEMVSAAKLRKAQSALFAGRPYAAKLQELMASLATSPVCMAHPIFQEQSGSSKTLVIFTSDRGLCGAFNTNLIKKAEEILASEPETKWSIVCVGRKVSDYFRHKNHPILESIIGSSGQASSELAEKLSKRLIQLFLSGETNEVWLLYPSFISTVVNRPTLTRYLPMTPESLTVPSDVASSHPVASLETTHNELDYIFDEPPQEFFKLLVPHFLRSRLYITLAEASASEHSARMVAMNNATSNCEEMTGTLTLHMNRARQDTITTELLEIVSGAEALKANA